MTRLINYLTEEMPAIRSEQLTEQEAIDMINKNCSKILEQYKKHPSWYIYRGLKLSPNYQFTNPAKAQPRRSLGDIGNYYTLLMDNLPNWKKYPKRSRSLICSRDINAAKGYGDAYVVFPYNNATFGVCPELDIWISFLGNISNLRTFNRDLKKLLILTTHGVKNFDKDWNRLTKSFKMSEERIKNNLIPNDTINNFKLSFKQWIIEILNGKTYIETFKKYMDPNKNNFDLTKDPTTITQRRELWTDSKCVLVYHQLVDEVFLDKYEHDEKDDEGI